MDILNELFLYIEIIILVILIIILAWYVHDKYVQRDHQLLVNYPIIGRLRYLLEEAREPFRQYFGDEKFYESKDKLDWVYKASRDLPNYASFSPSQPLPKPKFMLRHATIVLNEDEVDTDFSVTFGLNRNKPYKAKSIIARSAMSDGSISPEGTRAFVRGSFMGDFPINSGEGGLTSNFFVTHQNYDEKYMEIVHGTAFQKRVKNIVLKLFNGALAADVYRKLVFKDNPEAETYVFDARTQVFHRPNWNAPLEFFPKEVPEDMPDIILQVSSGLYSVRTKDGKFDPERYQKVMRFCRMTEIKIAQGAKQTGGKLIADKVSPAIAYYRNVEAHKDLFSPNRFPYANTIEELFDFIGQMQELSEKPVGVKIVISDYENIVPFAKEIKKRIEAGSSAYPDFISIDGGSGGSATAPIEMMERIGLNIRDSIYLVNKVLEDHGVRQKVKLVASGKLLTPDDIIVIMALGADFVQIARGFMMSAGCIRARYCSGTTGHDCPVGLATQNKEKRKKYFVHKQAKKVRDYHKNLLKSVRGLLAVMGLKNIKELDKHKIMFLDRNSKVHDNIDDVFGRILDIGKDKGDKFHES
ncbi:FMN-binding glutamate synthase family protein [Halarcobacter bivalviorum]|uniref:FMN-binding glutamate synthase family protein n=1 Tax=Halarcobacter bivalviorum TaxID=663364 RepID=A0AAX2ACV8_9BACT|nr:FMN-binding glutamate synthase family protein [Halarcobacter bivalviorum]AXH11817.1 FMN-binding glutamate synthase family protein [Halarcobacter bivalviorum]RXK10943.1 FMN-binding glutamate synthase family protein [Halarcobacter bivalviorum]